MKQVAVRASNSMELGKKKILCLTHEKENLRFGRIQDCGAENQKFHN